MNCNHPVVRKFILDCLRYWVTEMHVDGFRFDLAAVFAIDVDGKEKGKTPIIEEIETDPVLSRIKLDRRALVDPPVPARLLLRPPLGRVERQVPRRRPQVRQGGHGRRPPSSPPASPAPTTSSPPTTSSERSPYHSINFVTCHDGFTLNDLVSYNEKHNERNGEGNRDGHNENESWNCGVEGPVADAEDLDDEEKETIERLRVQQIKNFLTLLFLSQGTPMLLYGDEMRRTAFGNNNTVYQDNALNWLNWENLKTHHEIHRFTKQIIAFRKKHSIIRRWRYMTAEEDEGAILRNITWHGVKPEEPDFSGTSRFLAWTLEAFETEERLGRADLRRQQRLLGADRGRAARAGGPAAGIGSSTPPCPRARTSSPRRRPSSSPSDDYEVRPRSTIVLIAR